ncbi:hypothetical protein C8R47DRAFT_1077354 [Mycena vitilis]|nr:hypothetical protein C8R47DRAFT_1077354 [Mycena vitilis]
MNRPGGEESEEALAATPEWTTKWSQGKQGQVAVVFNTLPCLKVQLSPFNLQLDPSIPPLTLTVGFRVIALDYWICTASWPFSLNHLQKPLVDSTTPKRRQLQPQFMLQRLQNHFKGFKFALRPIVASRFRRTVPAHRARRKIVLDSDSDDLDGSEDTADISRVKQEECGAPILADSDDVADYELEYFDELPPVLPPTPGLRPLEDDDVDRAIMRAVVPGLPHSADDEGAVDAPASALVPPPSTLSPANNAGPLSPTTVDVDDKRNTRDVLILAAPAPDANSAASGPAEPARRATRGTKRKMVFLCDCGDEVTEAERETSAVQCTRVGCETIWCFSITRNVWEGMLERVGCAMIARAPEGGGRGMTRLDHAPDTEAHFNTGQAQAHRGWRADEEAPSRERGSIDRFPKRRFT